MVSLLLPTSSSPRVLVARVPMVGAVPRVVRDGALVPPLLLWLSHLLLLAWRCWEDTVGVWPFELCGLCRHPTAANLTLVTPATRVSKGSCGRKAAGVLLTKTGHQYLSQWAEAPCGFEHWFVLN